MTVVKKRNINMEENTIIDSEKLKLTKEYRQLKTKEIIHKIVEECETVIENNLINPVKYPASEAIKYKTMIKNRNQLTNRYIEYINEKGLYDGYLSKKVYNLIDEELKNGALVYNDGLITHPKKPPIYSKGNMAYIFLPPQYAEEVISRIKEVTADFRVQYLAANLIVVTELHKECPDFTKKQVPPPWNKELLNKLMQAVMVVALSKGLSTDENLFVESEHCKYVVMI